MAEIALQWVKDAPKQSRSQKTLDQLLDAVERLLDAQRFASLSVQAITAEAGCSVGTFYTRFEAKEDVLRVLYARYATRSRRTLAVWSDPTRWEGVPLADVIASLVAFIVADYRGRRGVRRAVDETLASDAALFAMMEALTADTIAGLARLLAARHSEHDQLDPEAAAAFVHRLVFAVLDQDLRFDRFPGGHDLDDDALAASLTDAVRAWLGVHR